MTMASHSQLRSSEEDPANMSALEGHESRSRLVDQSIS